MLHERPPLFLVRDDMTHHVLWTFLLLLAFCCGCGAEERVPSPAKTTGETVERLRAIVRAEQKRNIRESWGEYAHECFTTDDLQRFKRRDTAGMIADRLRATAELSRAVAPLVGRSRSEIVNLLSPLRRPLRPTWAELGRISREGQTGSGNQAERLIAEAIVDMAIEVAASRR